MNRFSQFGMHFAPLCLIIFITGLVYLPGLSGGFLFDDLPNLSPLGNLGGINHYSDAWAFATSGNAGPLGRPISLLSFTLNAGTWPADPYPFLLSNLALHISAGIFVYLIIFQLLSLSRATETSTEAQLSLSAILKSKSWFNSIALPRSKQLIIIALIASLFWTLNPFLVSTTLYIIQRMTILASLFCLIGISIYLIGRVCVSSRPIYAYILMSLAVGLGMALAALSKESGILLPMYILVIETTVIASSAVAPLSKPWKGVFLQLPSLGILSYLVINIPRFNAGYLSRDFNLQERLYTQANIIWDYISHLLVPQIATTGLFYDSYPISTSFSQPWTTSIAILAIATVLIFGLWAKKRLPFIALTILFFFAGHIIESTVVPLELYFEHRNYLPAIFLFLPFVIWVSRQSSIVFPLLIIVALATFALTCHQRASLWGNQSQLYLVWAQKNIESERAVLLASHHLEKDGNYQPALVLIKKALIKQPHNLSFQLRLLANRLGNHKFSEHEYQTLLSDAPNREFPFIAIDMLRPIVRHALIDSRFPYNLDKAKQLLLAFSRNPSAKKGTRGDYHISHLLGELALKSENTRSALHYFEQAHKASQLIEPLMQEVALLAEHKAYNEALGLLELGDITLRASKRKSEIRNRLRYINEISRLRTAIQKDAALSIRND